MMYSEFWTTLVNYDTIAQAGYPHQARFWRVVLPGFQNRVHLRIGRMYYQRKSWTANVVANGLDSSRIVALPVDFGRFDQDGLWFLIQGQQPYQLNNLTEDPAGFLMSVNSTLSDYPAGYIVRLAETGEITPVDNNYDTSMLELNRIPLTSGTLSGSYIKKFPIPSTVAGTYTDVELRYYFPEFLIPGLAHFFRAQVILDRANQKDTRFSGFMTLADQEIEILSTFKAGGQQGSHIIGSN